MRTRGRGARFLVVAMAIVVVSFFVETAYMFWVDGRVSAESAELQQNALPSVNQLSVARAILLRISGCIDSGIPVSVVRPCVSEARRELTRSLNDYLGMPMYPDELAQFARVERNLRAFDALGEEALVHGLTPPRAAGMQDSLVKIDDALRRLVVLDADRAFAHAKRIDELRSRSELFELAIGGAAVVLACISTLLAVAAIRRHARILEQRAHELEMFASTVAHDLVGPLTSVSIAVPLIQERHPDDAQTRQLGDRALGGVRRVRALVEALLEFAKAGTTNSSGPADLSATVEAVIREAGELAQAEHIELRVEDVEPAAAAVAPGVLVSVLSNLVRNAIKHMGDGEPRRIVLRGRCTQTTVGAEVEDTGPGIPDEAREVIFEPHVRLPGVPNPGLGLGLATVKRLVLAHGGRVGVRPRAEGRGSVFWFELPRA